MPKVEMYRESVTILLIAVLALGPVGCGSSDSDSSKSTVDAVQEWTGDTLQDAGEMAQRTWSVTKDKASGAWTTVQSGTSDALEVISEQVQQGSASAADAANAAWVWSRDTSTDGWEWIKTSANGTTEWAFDQSKEAWMITEQKSGEFYMWVKVESDEGVAWARTAIPAAWKVTKDSAGEAWVWIDEHRIEAAVAASVVALVVGALILEPVGTTMTLVKSAASKATIAYLATLYQKHQDEMKGVSEEEFQAIGQKAIAQNGAQIVAHYHAENANGSTSKE